MKAAHMLMATQEAHRERSTNKMCQTCKSGFLRLRPETWPASSAQSSASALSSSCLACSGQEVHLRQDK